MTNGHSELPYPMPEGGPAPQQPHTAGIIATALVVTAIAVVLIIFLRPYSEKAKEAQTKKLEAERVAEELKILEEKRLVEYAALEKEVRPLYREAEKKLADFKAAAKAVFQEVETVARRSLERLTAASPDVPKEIVDAYRFVEAFRTPWNELLNAYTATKDLRDDATLPPIGEKIEKQQLREADRDALKTFIESTGKAHARLSAQRGNLDAIRRILAQRELDAISSKPDRSTP